jgi:hypothetical protein
MRGLKQLRCAQVISTGHAFIQNLHRGHYELGVEKTHDPVSNVYEVWHRVLRKFLKGR